MSVLPLVFPSNISCFSRGSYKEELARKRELPVPPLPKRSGIWARSNEDLQGLTSSGSVSPVSSDSSASNIVRFTSDTCLPRSAFRNDGEILNRSTFLDFLNTQMEIRESSEPGSRDPSELSRDPSEISRDQSRDCVEGAHVGLSDLPIPEKEATAEAETTSAPISRASSADRVISRPNGDEEVCIRSKDVLFSDIQERGIKEESVRTEKSYTETDLSDQRFLGSQINLSSLPVSELSLATLSVATDVATSSSSGVDTAVPSSGVQSSEKLNTMFRKSDKSEKKSGGEIFRAALERLSFRSSKKKKGARGKAEAVKSEAAAPSAAAEVGAEVVEVSDQAVQVKPVKNVEAPPQTPVVYKPPLPPGRRRPPASATWEQSRPINQLDSALKQFRSATAESRENLTQSKPDISAIEAEVARSHPGQSIRSRRGSDGTTTQNGHHEAFKLKLVAPPKNTYVDTQWEKLSASMASLNGYRMGRERPQIEQRVETKGSTQSLMQGEEELGTPATLPRTQSVTVLNHVNNKNTSIQVPENRLQQLTPHQARIRDSMDRLNIPTWYSNRSENSEGPQVAPPTPRRQAGGWRRHVSHSRSVTPATEGDSNRSRWSSRTLPLSYRTYSHSSLSTSAATPSTTTPTTASTRQPYLGWRSQERLDIGPAYLASPAMRLASTATPLTVSTPSRSNTLPPSTRIALSKNIRQVSEEIQDYCKSEETPASSSTPTASPTSSSSSPSPPPKPIEAWSDTPIHQNGRGHMIVA